MDNDSMSSETAAETGSVNDKIVYQSISHKSATFKSGTQKKIHGWFRLTPSFGPDLVDIMLDKLQYHKGEWVLDPFGGASTTLIQCRLQGIPSMGFEINPLLQFVGSTSLEWDIDLNLLVKAINRVEKKYYALSKKLIDTDVEDCGLPIPTIHNVFRWWRRDVLKELLILKHCIRNSGFSEPVINFLLLALAGVLVPGLTNVTLGKLQLHFIDRDKDTIKVYDTYKKHISQMLDDLAVIQFSTGYRQTPAKLYYTDSTDIEHIRPEHKASLVITSPPYPNRYSYTWNTRPHLYFLDLFDNAQQASLLDSKTIGGTWGMATTRLVKGIVEPLYPVLQHIVEPLVQRIREEDNLMANYVMKYFNLLTKQIIEMEKVVTDNVRVAYVVGNSEIKGVYVETDVLLGKIFEGLKLGYRVTEITRFRKRNSGTDLYESIVYATR